MPLSARLASAATVLSLLIACSGGSNTGSTPPPPVAPQPTAPTAEDLANARASQLKMTLRHDTKYLTISWTDTFASERGFRVESRAPDGTWQTIASAPSGAATGGPFEVARTIDAPNTYRVSALVAGYAVPLQTAAGQSEILVEFVDSVSVRVDSPTITLQGSVRLSFFWAFIQNTPVQEVDFYLDSDALGSSSSDRFDIVWDTTTAPNGPHELHAVARLTSGAFIEVRRGVVVDNPDLVASLQVARVAGSLTDFRMAARASSAVGIRTVDFFVDNDHVQTLPGVAGSDYSYTVVTPGLAAGTHTFKIVATDNAAETVEATRQMAIENPPALTLASPLQDRIVTNSLHIEGTFADEQAGATLAVALGDITLLQTSSAGAFILDRSLSDIAPGEYTLAVRAIDSQGHHTLDTRNVIVEPGQAAIELIATDVLELLDVDDGAVLFKKSDGTMHLRDASGSDVTLQVLVDISLVGNFDLSAGHVATTWPGGALGHNVYVFDPSGQPTNVSELLGTESNSRPRLSYPWLTWSANSVSQVEIYNLVTQARGTVAAPASGENALITTAGAEQLLYEQSAGGSGSGARYNVLLHDLASGVTQRLGDNALYRDLQTDNVRVAWGRHPLFTTFPEREPGDLVVAPVANPTATTTISTAMAQFMLDGGLLAWTERNGDGTAEVKVHDGTSTIEITPSASSAMVAADGRVTFQENGKVYVWRSGTGKQVLLNSLPSRAVLHNGGIGFFMKGATPTQTLYRIPLPD